jgi:methylenetetrahydrofolate reductase (NADPH)
MHVRDCYGRGRSVFSIEIFPPKTEPGVAQLKQWLREACALAPDFISVTYGAGGGTRHTTHDLCAHIKNGLPTECMAHLTCVAHTRDQIDELLAALHAQGIENIMALRGDPPRGETSFVPPPGGFRYATELVRALTARDRFCVGVAGYPEGHVEAPSYEADLRRQIEKIEAGADLIVSQFFLENGRFLKWRDDLRHAGVKIPIVPGILPAQSLEQITRFAGFCGVAVPEALRSGLARFEHDPDSAARFGIEFAQRQVESLLGEEIDGVHLYALNKLAPVQAIAPMVKPLAVAG